LAVEINYQPEPTPALFHACDDFCRGLMGPVGSGKSVAGVLEMFIRGAQQRPAMASNGRRVRRTRWAAIRNTYPELKTTTIKTFQDWFPPEIAKFRWDIPITARILTPLNDGTWMDMEVIFIAMDRPQDVNKLKSLELTGAWLNEASELPKAALDMATSRVGRYPAKRDGGPSWRGIVMDTNPPDDDHWYYNLAEEELPQVQLSTGEMLKYTFFRQPPALLLRNDQYIPNPVAENIKNLEGGYDYYYQQIPGKTKEWIKVFVLGQYGTIHDGRPVYPEWSDGDHSSPHTIDPMRGVPIILGWDFGLTPACIIAQYQPHPEGAVLCVLEELIAEDMGIRQFAKDIVKPHLVNHYNMMPLQSVGDPAGTHRGETDQSSAIRELRLQGIPTEPAPSNVLTRRRDAVASFLTKRNGFRLDPRCKVLRKGFNGGYKFERVQVSVAGGDGRFKDQPSKNRYSHPHDALQYIALHIEETVNMNHRRNRRARETRPLQAGGWT
jgi:hypothetical protein